MVQETLPPQQLSIPVYYSRVGSSWVVIVAFMGGHNYLTSTTIIRPVGLSMYYRWLLTSFSHTILTYKVSLAKAQKDVFLRGHGQVGRRRIDSFLIPRLKVAFSHLKKSSS